MKFRTHFDTESKVWAAPHRPYTFGDRSIGDVVMESLKKDLDFVVEVNHDNGNETTCGELLQMSVNAARTFTELGVKEEDVVVLLLNNSEFCSALCLGSVFLGAPFCALELGLDRTTLRNLIYQLQPKVICCEKQEFMKASSIVAELNLICKVFSADPDGPAPIETIFEDWGDVDSFEPTKLFDVENKVAAIVSSSATMGTYKLISVSHPQLLHNYTGDFGIVQTIFAFSTLNWITGIGMLLGSVILRVKRVITAQDFDPELLLDIIEQHKVNLLILQPDRLNAVLRTEKINHTDFSELYITMVTGKPLSSHMKQKFEEYLTAGCVVTTYGMTETAGTITSSIYSSDKEGSTGILVDNTSAKIVDDNGIVVAPGKVGEIHVQGEFKFLGYYNNAALTASSIDSEGYLKTGDIGYFDEDGELYIVDRKKDTIVVGKSFVYPSILEGIILQHEGVYDVCIIDVPHKELNFVPVAAVIRSKASKVTEQDIVDFVANRQPVEQQLKGGAIFVNELPKTTSGKFKRYLVREIVSKTLISNYL